MNEDKVVVIKGDPTIANTVFLTRGGFGIR